MNNIKVKIDDLFDELEQSKLYNDYVKVLNQLKNDKEINDLINEIKRLQKILANNKDSVVEKKLDELYSKLKSFPVYQSYLNIKEDLNDELYEIKEAFEKYFHLLLEL